MNKKLLKQHDLFSSLIPHPSSLLFRVFRRAMLGVLALLACTTEGGHHAETFLDECGWQLGHGLEGLRSGDDFKLDERRQFFIKRQVAKLRTEVALGLFGRLG